MLTIGAKHRRREKKRYKESTEVREIEIDRGIEGKKKGINNKREREKDTKI